MAPFFLFSVAPTINKDSKLIKINVTQQNSKTIALFFFVMFGFFPYFLFCDRETNLKLKQVPEGLNSQPAFHPVRIEPSAKLFERQKLRFFSFVCVCFFFAFVKKKFIGKTHNDRKNNTKKKIKTLNKNETCLYVCIYLCMLCMCDVSTVVT